MASLFSYMPLFISKPAYLDPGSGSILLQLLLAGLLGLLVVLRTSWSKIKSFFTRSNNTEEEEHEE
jgi:hypothetical protein